MKIFLLSLSLLIISLLNKNIVYSTNLKVEKNFQPDKVKKISNLYIWLIYFNKSMKYLNDAYNYIPNHSNKENFIAIFGNYTKADVTKDLNGYIDNNNKEIQYVIDKINNFQTNNIIDWEFDSAKQKFTLPDESNLRIFKISCWI